MLNHAHRSSWNAHASQTLLETELHAVPSQAELERIVYHRVENIYPEVPVEAVEQAAHYSAELVLRGANPKVAAFLPDLALREARAIINLYVALGRQDHLRVVA
jgi:hypothetical protein